MLSWGVRRLWRSHDPPSREHALRQATFVTHLSTSDQGKRHVFRLLLKKYCWWSAFCFIELPLFLIPLQTVWFWSFCFGPSVLSNGRCWDLLLHIVYNIIYFMCGGLQIFCGALVTSFFKNTSLLLLRESCDDFCTHDHISQVWVYQMDNSGTHGITPLPPPVSLFSHSAFPWPFFFFLCNQWFSEQVTKHMRGEGWSCQNVMYFFERWCILLVWWNTVRSFDFVVIVSFPIIDRKCNNPLTRKPPRREILKWPGWELKYFWTSLGVMTGLSYKCGVVAWNLNNSIVLTTMTAQSFRYFALILLARDSISQFWVRVHVFDPLFSLSFRPSCGRIVPLTQLTGHPSLYALFSLALEQLLPSTVVIPSALVIPNWSSRIARDQLLFLLTTTLRVPTRSVHHWRTRQ